MKNGVSFFLSIAIYYIIASPSSALEPLDPSAESAIAIMQIHPAKPAATSQLASASNGPFSNPLMAQAQSTTPQTQPDDSTSISEPAHKALAKPPANSSVGEAIRTMLKQEFELTDDPAASEEDIPPPRRGKPAPLDPVFPMTEYVGVDHQLPIGVPDTGAIYPLEKMLWKTCPILKKARIRVYGWSNPGIGYSSSKHSNIPNSYYITPRRLELDQLCLRVERVPDTVQRDHMDWGFRFTGLYGIDYRYTTAQGWYPASRELLGHNYLYGFDPVELYGSIYIPKVAKGLVLKFGRYISPPDIEAQLAPDNFLWTHSQMFTVDCYTQTGLLASLKLNDQWTVQAGIHSGCDIAPWDRTAIPTAEAFVRWTSKSNNDSIYGGVDAVNNGQFRLGSMMNRAVQYTNTMNAFASSVGSSTTFSVPKIPAHDNLQQFNITWSHRFNKRGTVVTMTEAYYLYTLNALMGGTVNNGPPKNFNALTGPGSFLPGYSQAAGFVNYTAFKVSPKDYICIRPIDFLLDPNGWRTGFRTAYSSWTIGWCHRFSDLVCIRPEIRYDRAFNYNNGTIVTPYDNGTRRYQFSFGLDLIKRF